MSDLGFTIGKLAKAADCKPETIRYYERIGLLPAPARNEAGYRLYGKPHQNRLTFIRRARKLGFSLEDIGKMLLLTEDRESSCREISRLSNQHLDTIREKLDRLTALSAELNSLISQCSEGKISECRILEALLDNDPPEREKNHLS